MWSVVTQISTGLGLVAFIIAVLVKIYSINRNYNLKELKSFPSKTRDEIAKRVFGPSISTENLSPDQNYQLSLEWINIKKQRDMYIFYVAISVAAIAVIISLFPQPHPLPTPQVRSSKLYKHSTGFFVDVGDGRWVEFSGDSNNSYYTFCEDHVDDKFIYLYDRNRVFERGTVLHLRIPLKGGTVEWSYENPMSWIALYIVEAIDKVDKKIMTMALDNLNKGYGMRDCKPIWEK